MLGVNNQHQLCLSKNLLVGSKFLNINPILLFVEYTGRNPCQKKPQPKLATNFFDLRDLRLLNNDRFVILIEQLKF